MCSFFKKTYFCCPNSNPGHFSHQWSLNCLQSYSLKFATHIFASQKGPWYLKHTVFFTYPPYTFALSPFMDPQGNKRKSVWQIEAPVVSVPPVCFCSIWCQSLHMLWPALVLRSSPRMDVIWEASSGIGVTVQIHDVKVPLHLLKKHMGPEM